MTKDSGVIKHTLALGIDTGAGIMLHSSTVIVYKITFVTIIRVYGNTG
jgi:hypothetical protein